MQAQDLLPFLDATYLEDKTHLPDLMRLCDAIKIAPALPAGICVFSRCLTLVKETLKNIPLAFISVINFPKGESSFSQIQSEIKEALSKGATELDIVVPYQSYLQGDRAQMKDFMAFCRRNTPATVKLKWILETGEIKNPQDIYHLSLLACENGADFIKTSTGKVKNGTSLEATACMLQAIKDYFERTQIRVGLKVSGGVRTLPQAMLYVQQVKTMQSEDELNPQHFRIGASQLFYLLCEENQPERLG